MKLKLLILIPTIGVASAMPPIASVASATNIVALNANEDENKLEIENKLTELKSINKSCEGLFWHREKPCFPGYHYFDINSMISVESTGVWGVQDGKTERDDFFTLSSKTNKNETYYRYEPNHIQKSNHVGYGNAKKYQLNVTVPANTAEYKVQIVASCKIENSIDAFYWDKTIREYIWYWSRQRTFMQGNLSRLSTDPYEMLMPAMGTKTDKSPEYFSNAENKIITKDSFLEDYYQGDEEKEEKKPHIEAKLTNEIILSNETPEAKEIPVYFWYGFFGGGFTGIGAASIITYSEVTFSANHIVE